MKKVERRYRFKASLRQHKLFLLSINKVIRGLAEEERYEEKFENYLICTRCGLYCFLLVKARIFTNYKIVASFGIYPIRKVIVLDAGHGGPGQMEGLLVERIYRKGFTLEITKMYRLFTRTRCH
ncbi:hypothetical protein ACFSOZ_22910 [Mesorhizobium newzealandense]|uniref:N-acetylmuramoyl-L-alanine amidase n=1 Tax=Mesorhizobium newzealandense TaxID=1300302 RepID=A0ABW4UE31_9HYPH